MAREARESPEGLGGRSIYDLAVDEGPPVAGAGAPPEPERRSVTTPGTVPERSEELPPESRELVPFIEEFKRNPELFIKETVQRLAVIAIAMPTLRPVIQGFLTRITEISKERASETRRTPPVRREPPVRGETPGGRERR